MGGALVRGWIQAGILDPARIRLHNPRPASARLLAQETGALLCPTATEAVAPADLLLVAVKPPLVVPVLEPIRDALRPTCLVLSVAAGVRIATLEATLRDGQPVVRALPNTPALIRAGAAAFCRGTYAGDEYAALTRHLFEAVGCCAEVSEPQIDAALGVASSGVAFVYLFLEALIDGGVRAGLPREIARQLAAQTVAGAARMVQETDEHPGALKDAVTTPGGTTIAGLEILEKAAVRGAVIEAVRAAAERSRQLG